MPCTCGNAAAFEACCEPIIAGKRPAATAEQLMRARYSAYAKGEIDFLFESLASSERKGFDREGAEQWSKAAEWLGLEVKRTEQGSANDTTGVVEFVARYRVQEKTIEHHEIATFTKEDGKWHFLDGQTPKPQPFRRTAPKIGPNDPCQCGSGKKHKKCCGKP